MARQQTTTNNKKTPGDVNIHQFVVEEAVSVNATRGVTEGSQPGVAIRPPGRRRRRRLKRWKRNATHGPSQSVSRLGSWEDIDTAKQPLRCEGKRKERTHARTNTHAHKEPAEVSAQTTPQRHFQIWFYFDAFGSVKFRFCCFVVVVFFWCI